MANLPTGTSAFVGACDGLFTPRPLGAFADIAESIGGEVAELIERGARPYEVIGPLADKLSTRPTVLVLEDLHWADESTLDLLRLLARRAEGLGTLVIGTYRDDELGPAHPLRIVVGELKSTTSVLRLRLPALSPDAVHALAAPLGVDADALYANTAGNPFFVTEALAGGGEADTRDGSRRGVRARCTVGPAPAACWRPSLLHHRTRSLGCSSALPTTCLTSSSLAWRRGCSRRTETA